MSQYRNLVARLHVDLRRHASALCAPPSAPDAHPQLTLSRAAPGHGPARAVALRVLRLGRSRRPRGDPTRKRPGHPVPQRA
ncbi:putative leader peptide [Streptomyces albus]